MKELTDEEAKILVHELEGQLAAFRKSEVYIKKRLLKICAEHKLSCVIEDWNLNIKAMWIACILSGVLMVGINYQTYDSYSRYGWSYQITTTIQGVSTVSEVSFFSQFMVSLLFDYLCVVFFYVSFFIRELELKREIYSKENTNNNQSSSS